RVVFHIPDWLHHLLMGGRILFKNTLEAYTDYYLQHKLNQVVQEHRLVSLITLLREGDLSDGSMDVNSTGLDDLSYHGQLAGTHVQLLLHPGGFESGVI
ncbi:hypothetical protein XENOCAPTIV_030822, partial [Xenoophorus captivus]